MHKMMGAAGAAVLVLALHAPAQALDVRIGASGNYGTENAFGVGPRIELDIAEYVPGLRLAWDLHQYFDTGTYTDVDGLVVESATWDAGFHVTYDVMKVPIAEGATLYVGAGVIYADRNYEHWLKRSSGEISDAELRERYTKLSTLEGKYKDDSGASFALSLGTTFVTGWTVIPFVEARYTTGVVDELMFAGGILFSTGSGAK